MKIINNPFTSPSVVSRIPLLELLESVVLFFPISFGAD